MNDLIWQLMVVHLILNNNKGFGFLLINSIKNGGITNMFIIFKFDYIQGCCSVDLNLGKKLIDIIH